MSKFAMVPTEAIDSDLSDAEFRVYTAYLSFRNKKTGKAWPSAGELSLRTGMPIRTVERYRQSLARKGWLARQNVPHPGQTAEFIVNLKPEMVRTDCVAIDDEKVRTECVAIDDETAKNGTQNLQECYADFAGMVRTECVAEHTRTDQEQNPPPNPPQGGNGFPYGNSDKEEKIYSDYFDENLGGEMSANTETLKTPGEEKNATELPFNKAQFDVEVGIVLRLPHFDSFWNYLVRNGGRTREGAQVSSIEVLHEELHKIRLKQAG